MSPAKHKCKACGECRTCHNCVCHRRPTLAAADRDEDNDYDVSSGDVKQQEQSNSSLESGGGLSDHRLIEKVFIPHTPCPCSHTHTHTRTHAW